MSIISLSGLVSLAIEEIDSDGAYEFFVTFRKPDEANVGASREQLPMDQESVVRGLISSFEEERIVRSN